MLPRLYSAISTPAHRPEVTVASETKKTVKRTRRLTPGYDDDAGPSSMQLTAPHRAGVHYAIVQYLSHPRPVVLQLRAILHITVENKSLRNRARPRRDGARGCCSMHARWHKIIASFIPGNDLIAWMVIPRHRSLAAMRNRRFERKKNFFFHAFKLFFLFYHL